jgi:hypothetical protein
MLQMKRGDTQPDLVFYDVRDTNGNLVDLSDKIVSVVCRRRSQFLFSRTVTGDNQGTVTMPWVAGDTDVVGRLKFELKVQLEGGELTIPPEGHFDVEITQDLDEG